MKRGPFTVLTEGINSDLMTFQARKGNVAIRTLIGGLHDPRSFAAGLRTRSTFLDGFVVFTSAQMSSLAKSKAIHNFSFMMPRFRAAYLASHQGHSELPEYRPLAPLEL